MSQPKVIVICNPDDPVICNAWVDEEYACSDCPIRPSGEKVND